MLPSVDQNELFVLLTVNLLFLTMLSERAVPYVVQIVNLNPLLKQCYHPQENQRFFVFEI